jgi:hypothetical protein
MRELSEKVGGVDILNFGGGLPVNYHGQEPINLAEFVDTIAEAIRTETRGIAAQILFEPGRAVVAESADLLIPVRGVIGPNRIRIGDGVYGSFNSANLHGLIPQARAYRNDGEWQEIATEEAISYETYGPTCDAGDKMPMYLPPDLRAGDVLHIPSAGAYTAPTCATGFNGFSAPRWHYQNCQPESKTGKVIQFPEREKEAFRPEVVTSAKLTPKIIKEIADWYRYMFNNENEHFLAYPSTGEFISPWEFFNRPQGEYVSLAEMDAVRPEDLPYHPQTEERAVVFHDPELTRQQLLRQLGQNGHISILRDNATNEIVGLTFSYLASLRETFDREWYDDYVYCADHQNPDRKNWSDFLASLNLARQNNQLPPLRAQSEVFCWNCTTTGPQARGLKPMLTLTKNMIESLSPEKRRDKNISIVLHTKVGSTGHQLLQAVNAIDVPGFFAGETSILMSGSLPEIGDKITLPPRQFLSLVKQARIREREVASIAS